jgi:hypothetical protein
MIPQISSHSCYPKNEFIYLLQLLGIEVIALLLQKQGIAIISKKENSL